MLRVTGLDEMTSKLRKLADNARALDGQHLVPLEDLLNPGFLSRCSRFLSVDEMFEASGFTVESPEDFRAIPDEPWNAFIVENTTYPGWDAMKTEAAKEWTLGRLGL